MPIWMLLNVSKVETFNFDRTEACSVLQLVIPSFWLW